MKNIILLAIMLVASAALHAQNIYENAADAERAVRVHVDTSKEPIAPGKYKPTWQSLSDYECPDWFRDAKFGIWAHWGPQCQPEYGDWFARNMYFEGTDAYKFSKLARGPQKDFGFKDWINEWKAERWNPDSLVALYKTCGARYFFALANHHDNLDLWNSKYQPWNSVNMGPHRDIVKGWADACKRAGLPLGLSVHAAHAWTWYEPSRGADTKGTFAGLTYDGRLTKADGQGQWWEGYDPQDLYEQRHKLSADNREWDWNPDKVTLPDQAYCDRFYNRTMDLINRYHPSIIYFDDTVLPLYPFCDAGLNLLAHVYNSNMAAHGGKNEAVVTGKVLREFHKNAMVWDVERGAPDAIQPRPWQTCTCIGSWHYDKRRFYNGNYKSAQAVVQMLADVVSKNGNLLLSVPVRGDGTIDSLELKVVLQIGRWLKQNGEAIYASRPWRQFGEGPALESKNPMREQGFNEGKTKYTASDIRYTQRSGYVYAITMKVPEPGSEVALSCVKKARRVSLLGYGDVKFRRSAGGIAITVPQELPNDLALVFRIR